jgi:CBS domain containing-hemolysin-like protein
MSAEAAILCPIAGWLLAATALAVSTLLSGPSLDGLARLAQTRPRLAGRLLRFLECRGEYQAALRVLLLAGLLLFLLPWWHRGGQGAPQGPAAVAVLLGAPVALWVLGELVLPFCPPRLGLAALAVAFPVVAAARLLLLPLLRVLQQPRRRAQAAAGHGDACIPCLEEELLGLLRQRLAAAGRADAGDGSSERRMIRGILALDERQVREVMTPRVDVDALPESATVREARARINESGHSRIAAYRDSIDHITGVVHAKDLLDAERARDDQPIASLVRRAAFIPESKSVRALLHEMQQARSHFAVVLDEYGGTAGIVTLEDLLEEIIGEIRDEYDTDEEEPVLRELSGGDLVVDGRVPIADVAARLGIDSLVDQDLDFETVGGLIVTTLGRIPAKGEKVETPELICEVLEADQRRILRARLTRRSRPADEFE